MLSIIHMISMRLILSIHICLRFLELKESVIKMSLAFVNDCLISNGILLIKPEVLACAALALADKCYELMTSEITMDCEDIRNKVIRFTQPLSLSPADVIDSIDWILAILPES